MEADAFPYVEGATSYCFDLTDGDGLAKYVFDDIENFLDAELSDWTKDGPTSAGEYTNVDYNGDAGWIGITWDAGNQAVYVNADMK